MEKRKKENCSAVCAVHNTLCLHIRYFLSHSAWVHCADDALSFSRTIPQTINVVHRPEYSTTLHISFDLNGLNCELWSMCGLLSSFGCVLWYDGATWFPSVLWMFCVPSTKYFAQKNDGVRLYMYNSTLLLLNGMQFLVMINNSIWNFFFFFFLCIRIHWIRVAILLVVFLHIVNFELAGKMEDKGLTESDRKLSKWLGGSGAAQKQRKFKRPFRENGTN